VIIDQTRLSKSLDSIAPAAILNNKLSKFPKPKSIVKNKYQDKY